MADRAFARSSSSWPSIDEDVRGDDQPRLLVVPAVAVAPPTSSVWLRLLRHDGLDDVAWGEAESEADSEALREKEDDVRICRSRWSTWRSVWRVEGRNDERKGIPLPLGDATRRLLSATAVRRRLRVLAYGDCMIINIMPVGIGA